MMLFKKLIFLYIIQQTFTKCLTTQHDSRDVIVETKNGKIRGRKYQTIGDGTIYYRFSGVPYAEPPIGHLRFESPVPKRNWTGVLDAINEAPSCTQQSEPIVGQEDCLYLNVYTPQYPTNTGTLLPVMVFIHGGAFQFGTSTYKELGPDYFLEHNVLIITFNYRLGIFGFLSTNDRTIPGNYGLKDQLLALKWVKENIRNFGGDNNKITVFGQSAGSASVSYLIQSPKSKGLFNAAILESGVSLSSWSYSRYGKEVAFTIGHDLGLDTKNSTELLNFLKTINVTHLQTKSLSAVAFKYLSINPRDGFIMAPVVEPEHPDAVITEKSHQTLQNGNFNKVPCIVGFNSLEGTFQITGLLRLIFLEFDLHHDLLAPIDMNIGDKLTRIAVGRKIHKFYFGNHPISLSNVNLMKFISDDQFVRPIREYVRLVSQHTNVYFYRFSYEGNLSGLKNRTTPGTTHSEELSYLWVSHHNGTKQDYVVRSKMVKLWTNFAKYNTPTPHREPLLENLDWPPSRVANSMNDLLYLDIGRDLSIHMNPENKSLSFWDELYKNYATPPFDTY